MGMHACAYGYVCFDLVLRFCIHDFLVDKLFPLHSFYFKITTKKSLKLYNPIRQ